jgi:hypothetical protein
MFAGPAKSQSARNNRTRRMFGQTILERLEESNE